MENGDPSSYHSETVSFSDCLPGSDPSLCRMEYNGGTLKEGAQKEMSKIEIRQTGILDTEAEAVVNAANENL